MWHLMDKQPFCFLPNLPMYRKESSWPTGLFKYQDGLCVNLSGWSLCNFLDGVSPWDSSVLCLKDTEYAFCLYGLCFFFSLLSRWSGQWCLWGQKQTWHSSGIKCCNTPLSMHCISHSSVLGTWALCCVHLYFILPAFHSVCCCYCDFFLFTCVFLFCFTSHIRMEELFFMTKMLSALLLSFCSCVSSITMFSFQANLSNFFCLPPFCSFYSSWRSSSVISAGCTTSHSIQMWKCWTNHFLLDL